MTYEQFLETAEWSDDIGEALDFDLGEPTPMRGYIYAGALYIERASNNANEWWLMLCRDEFTGAGDKPPEALTRRLFDFATEEGFFTEPTPVA